MAVEFRCPCGRWLRVHPEDGVRQGRCPACGRVLDIPEPEKALAPPGPAAPESSTALTDEPGRPRTDPTALAEGPPAAEALGEAAREVPDVARPDYRLSPPGQIGLVGFLGGPMSGVLLMARNYAKLGR